MDCVEINRFYDTLTLTGELWRPITGWEGVYEVSNLGRVKRLAYTSRMRNQSTEWSEDRAEKVYLNQLDTAGYPQVRLVGDESTRVARVHRLVAEAFLEPPSEQLLQECQDAGLHVVIVEHEDDNKRNAKVSNLRWCSIAFNNQKAAANRDYSPITGDKHYNAKLTEEGAREVWGLLKNSTLSQERIAEMYGVKQITVSNLNTGRSWCKVTGLPRKERSRKKSRVPKPLMEREEKPY